MSRQSTTTLVFAAVATAIVWALSPLLTGRLEPWDAEGPFYAAALATAGLVSGALRPRPLWAHYAGAVAGQVAYEILFLPVGPLILVGALFLMGYSLIFLATAAVAAFVRRRLSPPM